MNATQVILAGKRYTVKPLPIRQARAFREKFGAIFVTLSSAMRTAPQVELTDMQSIAGMLESVGGLLVGSVDQALDLVCEYAPDISADRERIETEGYDDEVIAAFIEVLKLLYPLRRLTSLTSGPEQQAT